MNLVYKCNLGVEFYVSFMKNIRHFGFKNLPFEKKNILRNQEMIGFLLPINVIIDYNFALYKTLAKGLIRQCDEGRAYTGQAVWGTERVYY